jgi:hypothetical protein
MIEGFLPRLQNDENTFPTKIDAGEVLIDTGNFSSAGVSVVPDQNAPKDMLLGDRIIASQGGGLLAVLRGGSLLLRSSRLSEILICKWDDVVRIVSRNYEHFTDLSSVVIKNIKGRVYSYSGFAKNFAESKVENYKYHQYIGDVALAEAARTQYSLLETFPAEDARVYKEQVSEGSGGASKELLRRVLSLDGTHDLVVLNSDGSVFTRIKNTNGELTLTYNDVNVIKINATQINLSKNGNPTVNLDDTGIQAVFSGSVVKLSSTGIQLTKGGSEHKVTGEGVYSTAGGHFVNVTSAGVAMG